MVRNLTLSMTNQKQEGHHKYEGARKIGPTLCTPSPGELH